MTEETQPGTVTLDEIQVMLADADSKETEAKKIRTRAAILLKDAYGEQLNKKLAEKDEPYGTVNHAVGDYLIVADFPKKVTWDDKKLKVIAGEIQNEWKESPESYIDIKYNVSEAKYKAWPDSLKEKFNGARTLERATTKITLKKKA
jgi:hypothetical protein